MKFSPFNKLLFAFLGLIIAMLLCRVIYSESLRYIFLLWNLFLAWVPYKLSLYLWPYKSISKWGAWSLMAAWLLFFPNALYIITDLVHLGAKTNVPTWFDALLIFIAAITGLMMAFMSLYNTERFFSARFNKKAAEKLVFACLFLGSFGVYLGRFLRWNSWDVLVNPLDLLREISVRFLFPVDHYRTWAITCLLTGVFSLLYITGKKMQAYNVQ